MILGRVINFIFIQGLPEFDEVGVLVSVRFLILQVAGLIIGLWFYSN